MNLTNSTKRKKSAEDCTNSLFKDVLSRRRGFLSSLLDRNILYMILQLSVVCYSSFPEI